MNPVIIVFVIATGYVAVNVVLPIIFWFTQTSASSYAPLRPVESQNDSRVQINRRIELAS
ncbi:MAG: hypothetical protein ABSF63_01705 [Candidatus Bathyarchaeia archaeon]